MKKVFFILAISLAMGSTITSCREEKDVEVETLAPDVEDSTGDEGFDTNPAADDN